MKKHTLPARTLELVKPSVPKRLDDLEAAVIAVSKAQRALSRAGVSITIEMDIQFLDIQPRAFSKRGLDKVRRELVGAAIDSPEFKSMLAAFAGGAKGGRVS